MLADFDLPGFLAALNPEEFSILEILAALNPEEFSITEIIENPEGNADLRNSTSESEQLNVVDLLFVGANAAELPITF